MLTRLTRATQRAQSVQNEGKPLRNIILFGDSSSVRSFIQQLNCHCIEHLTCSKTGTETATLVVPFSCCLAVRLVYAPAASLPSAARAVWSYLSQRRGEPVNGVIVLHSAVGGRANADAWEALERAVVDNNNANLEHVAVATFKTGGVWSPSKNKRDSPTQCGFFAPAIARGAKVFRHAGTQKSARRILQYVVGQPREDLFVTNGAPDLQVPSGVQPCVKAEGGVRAAGANEAQRSQKERHVGRHEDKQDEPLPPSRSSTKSLACPSAVTGTSVMGRAGCA